MISKALTVVVAVAICSLVFIQQQIVHAQTEQSAFRLTVLAPSHRPCESSVHIHVRMDNGYDQSGDASTAVSGYPGLIFDIPANEGNIYYVCVADEIVGGLLGTGNCEYNIGTSGSDMTVYVNAG